MSKPLKRRVPASSKLLLAAAAKSGEVCICLLNDMCICVDRAHSTRSPDEIAEDKILAAAKAKADSDKLLLDRAESELLRP